MTVHEQVILHTKLMSQDCSGQDDALICAACQAAEAGLCQQLKPGISPEDIADTFVSAAAFLAMAALSELKSSDTPERFSAGDVSFQKAGSSAACACLRTQARLLMAPYTVKGTAFLGV